MEIITRWQNFYIIIGAAAASLTGLMFVVVTLMADIETRVETANAGVSAFNTPTIVHFCMVLLLTGLLSAPWTGFAGLRILLGLVGIGGILYLIVVIGRMGRVPGYRPPLKDWLWYAFIPLLGYLVLLGAALLLRARPALALYALGGAMLALLFIGIRNAWDLVTYLAIDRSHPESNSGEKEKL